jgi:hypothetical protein
MGPCCPPLLHQVKCKNQSAFNQITWKYTQISGYFQEIANH